MSLEPRPRSPHVTGACGINEAHSDEDHPTGWRRCGTCNHSSHPAKGVEAISTCLGCIYCLKRAQAQSEQAREMGLESW